jgi:hypothetical protein
MRWGTVLRRAF